MSGNFSRRHVLGAITTTTTTYHTIPYHTIPYHTIPYHTIPYHTILYHTTPYCTAPHPTPTHPTTPHSTPPHHAMQYNTTQRNTIPRNATRVNITTSTTTDATLVPTAQGRAQAVAAEQLIFMSTRISIHVHLRYGIKTCVPVVPNVKHGVCRRMTCCRSVLFFWIMFRKAGI